MRVKFGPWTPDQPDLDSGGLEDAANCIPHESGYGAVRDGQTASGSSTVSNGSVIGFAPVNSLLYPTLNQGAYLFVGQPGGVGLSRFFCDDAFSGGTTSLTFASVNRTATYTSTTRAWSFVRFGTNVLASNALDTMQVGSISTNFRDQSASASAPVARCLATVRDFVFAGNITSGGVGAGGNRVQWCQINNPLRWTPSPRAQSDSQDLPDTGDILAMTGGDFAAIFTERSIWRATYVGSPVIFRFDEVAPGASIFMPWSAARYQNLTFFLGTDGFQLFDGQQVIPIGSGAINDYAFNYASQGTSPDFPGNKGIIDRANKLYIFCIHAADAQGNGNRASQLLVYNFVTRTWSHIAKTTTLITDSLIMAAGLGVATSPVALPRYDPIDRPGIGYFDPTSGAYCEFMHTNRLTATFATGEAQLFPDKRGFVRGVRPLIQGNSNTSITVEVGKRNKLTESVSYGAAVAVNANGVAPMRADARFHRVRINVAGGFERSIGFDLDATPSGKR